ncbi:MAG TPA: YfhO family protein, partial [Longimicrobiales bacterium]
WLTERAVVRRRVRDFAAFSLGIALMVFTSHMQLVYFCIWGVSLYFIFRAFQISRASALPAIAAFAVAGVIGVAAAAVQFVPPLQYLREWSHRADKSEQAEAGYAWSTSWSLHPEEIMSLVVPEFVGDNVQTETRSRDRYWGRNPFKLNHEYAGLIPLLLLPLAFVRRRDGRAIFFTTLAALALLYALGAHTPVFRLFYLIPGVKLFRAAGLIIFLYALSVVTLGAIAIDRAIAWVRDADAEKSVRRALWIGVGTMGVLALLASAGVFVDMWRSTIGERLDPQKIMALDANMPLIKAGFWISFAIALFVAASWEGYARGVFSARGLIIALSALAFLDLYRVGRPFVRGTVLMNDGDDPIRYTADESIQFLQARQQAGEIFRAIDLSTVAQIPGSGYTKNTLAMHGIEQLAGHHGNEMGSYRRLIGGDDPVNLLTSNLRLADITNTTYMLSPQALQVPGLTEVFRGSRTVVYRKDTALPRAYFVGNVEVLPENQVVARMLSPEFNAATTAVLTVPLPSGITIQAPRNAQVRWGGRTNTEQHLQVNTDAPALLMVLDNYYKAWHAQVDGRDTPILRANHTFRAIPVPAGQHEVVMTYSAETVSMWAFVSGAILVLLTILAFGPMLMDRRTSRVSEASP